MLMSVGLAERRLILRWRISVRSVLRNLRRLILMMRWLAVRLSGNRLVPVVSVISPSGLQAALVLRVRL